MNIVVVQNEAPDLNYLLRLLQTVTGPHRIAGFLSAGEVLTFAHAAPVDLLITDVRLPDLDGPALIQRLREQTGDLAVVVSSESGSFESVRACLRAGVSDYLLSPTETVSLPALAGRLLASRAIDKLSQQRSRENRLAQLLLGLPVAPAEELPGGNWGVILTVCENWEGPVTWQTTGADHDFVQQALAGDAPAGFEIIDLDGRRRVVLVPHERGGLPQIERLALRLHQALVASGIVVHTAYDCHSDGEEPGAVLRRVQDHLSREMRLETSTFVRPGNPPLKAVEGLLLENRERLAYSFAHGGLASAMSQMQATLDQLSRQGAGQPAIAQAIEDLFDVAHRYGDREASSHLPDPGSSMARVRTCRSYGELAGWVDTQMRLFVAAQAGAATPRELVSKLVLRVRDSYWENISLQAFAAEHGVSLAYFSRLFKNQMGMTFTHYQTQVRVDKAKELLARADMRLSDIGNLVGYGDPKYFSQLFRRVVGVSPLDYRRSLGPDTR